MHVKCSSWERTGLKHKERRRKRGPGRDSTNGGPWVVDGAGQGRAPTCLQEQTCVETRHAARWPIDGEVSRGSGKSGRRWELVSTDGSNPSAYVNPRHGKESAPREDEAWRQTAAPHLGEAELGSALHAGLGGCKALGESDHRARVELEGNKEQSNTAGVLRSRAEKQLWRQQQGSRRSSRPLRR